MDNLEGFKHSARQVSVLKMATFIHLEHTACPSLVMPQGRMEAAQDQCSGRTAACQPAYHMLAPSPAVLLNHMARSTNLSCDTGVGASSILCCLVSTLTTCACADACTTAHSGEWHINCHTEHREQQGPGSYDGYSLCCVASQ